MLAATRITSQGYTEYPPEHVAYEGATRIDFADEPKYRAMLDVLLASPVPMAIAELERGAGLKRAKSANSYSRVNTFDAYCEFRGYALYEDDAGSGYLLHVGIVGVHGEDTDAD